MKRRDLLKWLSVSPLAFLLPASWKEIKLKPRGLGLTVASLGIKALTVGEVDEMLEGLDLEIEQRMALKNRLLEKGLMEFGAVYPVTVTTKRLVMQNTYEDGNLVEVRRLQ